MDLIEFPVDFIEVLRLLGENDVEYLLVGGFAVAVRGYPRATADMDVWVARSKDNGRRIVAALRAFGFDLPQLTRQPPLKHCRCSSTTRCEAAPPPYARS